MGRKILCPHCNSYLNEYILKEKNSENICLVCGGKLDDSGNDNQEGWITWYYYGVRNLSGGYLSDKSIDIEKPGETSYLIKEFKAPPKDANGNCDAAKRELRKYVPDAFAETKTISKVQCPYCYGTQIQIVPKKWGLLMGFATNGYNRVCVRCQRKF